MIHPLKSSFLLAVAHSAGALYLQFPSGWRRYDDVDERVYLEMCSADSPGGFFNAEIKGAYESESVSDLVADLLG